MSAGVARMYAGAAGRVENCQVGVFAADVTRDGAGADRPGLYLPEKRADDRDRCRAAGIGDDVRSATEPELAWAMISRARKAGVPFGRSRYARRAEHPGVPVTGAVAAPVLPGR
jgi:SRSO17 transposase